MSSASDVSQAVFRNSCDCLDKCMVKIRHCIAQLSEEQVWWGPSDDMNSIANLLLHLSGNLKQWVLSGLGGEADTRNRPLEFSEQGPIPKADLLEQLQMVVDEAKKVLISMDVSDLLSPRAIQGFDVTGIGAIFDSIPHFKGHTQEIICLTRMQLGKAYHFHWQPSTVAEEA